MKIGVPKEIKNNENRVALTNATLPYALQLASKDWRKACVENEELKLGLNIVKGEVVYQAVGAAFDLPITDVDHFLQPII